MTTRVYYFLMAFYAFCYFASVSILASDNVDLTLLIGLLVFQAAISLFCLKYILKDLKELKGQGLV